MNTNERASTAIVIPVVPARGHGTEYAFVCLDCAGEGPVDVEATWEHADPQRASLECWCDRHLPNNAVEVTDGDERVGWSRLATVGRKVNSADRTSTPPHHLPPLPDECYPPGSVPIPVDPDSGSRCPMCDGTGRRESEWEPSLTVPCECGVDSGRSTDA